MVAVNLLTFIALAIFNVNAGYIAFRREICNQGDKILNDCNWCRCYHGEYQCENRNCKTVDMFGHFNDAIKDIDVGMEGHGVWRTTETACEPDVHYRRGPLLCVCDENGQWPNPTCRDTFQVLHPVETSTGYQDSTCMPTKLYLQECNVCLCPETGRLDPNLCTKKKCHIGDPVLQQLDIVNEEILDAYATCEAGKKYKLGCQTCTCLRNNRLICGNCTEKEHHYCNSVAPDMIFYVECNMCFCNKEGRMVCSVKQCVEPTIAYKTITDIDERYFELVDRPIELHKCKPGTKYRKGCNTCVCIVGNTGPMLACTTRSCKNETLVRTIREGCVLNTSYELNCLKCSCSTINGETWQLCETENLCSQAKDSRTETTELNSMHGYCEPLHSYWKECNSCQCLSDGQLVVCSDKKCSQAAISLELVPMLQHRTDCPRGSAYKIDCNICYCSMNGNSLCTTFECDKH